ncbi:MAG: HlyD family efflux transporter periplasmic adaptor subunit [Thermovenabulum sp.]|uniref:HlyD family efflux transporter periplasmic adaptor subunit n=1 Tax=Thermovenabulum sp. TaxID=3100335 RepID=UPI003C79D282
MVANKKGKVILLTKRKKSKNKFLVVFFVSVLLLFSLISVIYSNRYVIAGVNKINDFIETEGIIVRNEQVITSPYKGKIEYLVKSGERVRVGTPLFKVITDFEAKKKIEEDILLLKKQLEDEKNSSIPVIEAINKSIIELEKNLYNNNGKAESKSKLKTKLKALYDEKEKMLKERQKNIEIIEGKILELEKKLNVIEPLITSPVAGTVSFSIDGLEEILRIENKKAIENFDIFSLNINNNPEQKGFVEENDKVLKIIDNFNMYILADCKGAKLKIGKLYKIELSSGKNFEARLESVFDNGRAIFYINQDLPELYDQRKEKIKIILKNYEGITLPKSAIIRLGDKDGVYVKEKNRINFKPVDVICEEGGNVIVDGLKPGDIILVKRGFLWNFRQLLMNLL